jgi:lactoylglutathione lyase
MVLHKMLCTYLTLALGSISAVSACAGDLHNLGKRQNTLAVGTDDPQPHETKGYMFNHVGISTRNLTASKHFYGTVLGMRTVFTLTLTPTYSVTYMSYEHGGANGTGYQSAEEMMREKNNGHGLVSILEFPNEPVEASRRLAVPFAHLGMVVPSLVETQARLESFGVPIAVEWDEPIPRDPVAVAARFGLGTGVPELEQIAAGPNLPGVPKEILVQDPDGNVIEIQQIY